MNSPVFNLNQKELHKLYVTDNLSTMKIAKMYDCNPETVSNNLRKHGIELRGKGSYKGPKSPEHTAKLRETANRLHKGKFGENHPAWKGGRQIDSYGYVILRIGGKYVKEHRVVMEKHIGRKLEVWEEVHHIDDNKQNNALSNLVVYESFHKKHHIDKDPLWLRHHKKVD